MAMEGEESCRNLFVLVRTIIARVSDAVEALGFGLASELFLLAALGIEVGPLENAESGPNGGNNGFLQSKYFRSGVHGPSW